MPPRTIRLIGETKVSVEDRAAPDLTKPFLLTSQSGLVASSGVDPQDAFMNAKEIIRYSTPDAYCRYFADLSLKGLILNNDSSPYTNGNMVLDEDNDTVAGCQFISCNMQFSRFHGTRFIDCIFTECIMNRCSFYNCQFENCDMSDSDMSGSNFEGCEFRHTNFRRTILREANGSCNKFFSCAFTEADLIGSDGFACGLISEATLDSSCTMIGTGVVNAVIGRWRVVASPGGIKIGCQEKTHEEWEAISKLIESGIEGIREVDELLSSHATEYFDQFGEVIKALANQCKKHGWSKESIRYSKCIETGQAYTPSIARESSSRAEMA